MCVVGAGAAERHKFAALDLDGNFAAGKRLPYAVFIGVLQADIAKFVLANIGMFGQGAELRFRAAAFKCGAADFLARLIQSDGNKLAGHIYRLEICAGVCAHLLFGNLFTIYIYGRSGAGSVYLHHRLFALAVIPSPAVPRLRKLPGRGRMFFKRHIGAYNAHFYSIEVERHAGIERLCQRTAVEVKPAAACRNPAYASCELGGIVGVQPRADAYLAEIVYARPYKVAYKCGVLLCGQPELAGVGTEGFAAEYYPFGVLLHIALIAQYAVVIACHVHGGKGVLCLCVAAGQGCAYLHCRSAEKACKVVEELAADRLLFLACRLELRIRLFIAVNAEAERI